MNIEQQHVTFIGGGNMAQALIGGLIAQGIAAKNITVVEPVEALQQQLAAQGLNVVANCQNALKNASMVVLAVKPQVLTTVLQDIRDQVDSQVILSVIAGATVSSISRALNGYSRIVRVMPNTPSLIQAGAYGIYAATEVDAADRELVDQIFSATGLCLWVDDESLIDAVTAVSGSGPAYFFYLMEHMIAAGQQLGLDQKTAKALTLQTALGAAKMACSSEDDPAELRKKVTSLKGTTEAALNAFDDNQVNQHIHSALAAAHRRSQELAAILDQQIN